MARAATKKKTGKVKAFKPRRPRSEIKSINDKYFGTEPLDVSKRGLYDALNWYNYMYDHDSVLDWIFEYMKRHDYAKSDIAAVRRLPKHKISKTTCTLARIFMNGNTLEERLTTRLHENIATYIRQGNLIKEVVQTSIVSKAPPSIQERVRNKIQQLIADCEEAVDNNSQLNIYEWLASKEATAQAATAISNYYAKWIADFEYEDKFQTREEAKRNAERHKYWTQFVYDCERYAGNKKVVTIRKPRAKKVKSAVDQVSKMSYQKEFPALKIVSVNPAEIIGASQVWTYNTKYRKLARYDALWPTGIQVKGTTLIGFDTEKASAKAVRKPDATIKQLLSAGKIALRTMLADLSTSETKPNGRINTDTIILRVIK
jgi:hypothetical protein